MIDISLGVCAYNEEAIIGSALEAITKQETSLVRLREIIVVSSGSTDRTNEIVNDWANKDSRVILVEQQSRQGKATAINEFLRVAKSDILALANADALLHKNAIEQLGMAFTDPSVGMAGGHPAPLEPPDTFVTFAGNLMWGLHHRMSARYPKMGELIAFRRVFDEIPRDTAVDEAWIENGIRAKGLRLCYVPDALCYIHVPTTIRDFVKQRRRVWVGHVDLARRFHYHPSTMNGWRILRYMMTMARPTPRGIVWSAGTIGLEAWARMLGYYDYYVRKRNPYVWPVVESTKGAPPPASEQARPTNPGRQD